MRNNGNGSIGIGRAVCMLLLAFCVTANASLKDVVAKITPSVVAIGLYAPIEQSGNTVLGTGFVVGNGKQIITNYHVVSKILDPAIVQYYVVITGEGREVKAIRAEITEIDPIHDLALLTIGAPLPAISLAGDELVAPGTDVAFTGFPIGAAIGLYPATHKGIVSAISPDAIPAQNSDTLSLEMLKRLKQPSLIYQLDATAYPGNSGSPLYDSQTGKVLGVLNKVFVSQGKESALSAPSGISYAIPVKHVHKLLEKAGQ